MSYAPINLPWRAEEGRSGKFYVKAGENEVIAQCDYDGEFATYIARSSNGYPAVVRKLKESLTAWEDEEESVKDEHRELIDSTRALLVKLGEIKS